MQRSHILLLADLKGGGVGGTRNSFPGEHRWPRGGRCFRMGRCRNGMAEEGPAPSSACMGEGGHDGGNSCTAQCCWRGAGLCFCARVTSPGSCPASQPLSLQGQQHLVLTSERRSSFCWLGASHGSPFGGREGCKNKYTWAGGLASVIFCQQKPRQLHSQQSCLSTLSSV